MRSRSVLGVLTSRGARFILASWQLVEVDNTTGQRRAKSASCKLEQLESDLAVAKPMGSDKRWNDAGNADLDKAVKLE